MKRIEEIIRQPLFHFLLIGAVLFALYYSVNSTESKKDSIVIDDEQVSRIEMLFEKEWNRKPTKEELKGLLDKYIQQEVYYRKALTMNLDHNDEIIRRRLDQKLRFVTNDLAIMKEPSEDELKSFYTANKKSYLLPRQYSFSHVYFNPDKRPNPKKDATATLEKLPATDANLSALTKNGDPFPFSYQLDSLSTKDIAREMGDAFADTLKSLPIQKWTGPILSGYGVHLIFIREMKEMIEPPFSQIKEEVLKDYQYHMQQVYNDQLYKDFRKDFDIKLQISDPKHDKNLLSQLIGIDERK
ncbi:MAG: peptidyl-prolyl cis-trans isomerase [Chitinophagaceae bacterium]